MGLGKILAEDSVKRMNYYDKTFPILDDGFVLSEDDMSEFVVEVRRKKYRWFAIGDTSRNLMNELYFFVTECGCGIGGVAKIGTKVGKKVLLISV